MAKLRLYSRPDCHLCEQMVAELAPLLTDKDALEVIDISQDPGLEQRYGVRIPVLEADDRELSIHRLDRAKVERFLAESP